MCVCVLETYCNFQLQLQLSGLEIHQLIVFVQSVELNEWMWTNGQEVHLETGSKKISAAEVREKKEKKNYYKAEAARLFSGSYLWMYEFGGRGGERGWGRGGEGECVKENICG